MGTQALAERIVAAVKAQEGGTLISDICRNGDLGSDILPLEEGLRWA